jgi:hypothetical protein
LQISQQNTSQKPSGTPHADLMQRQPS